MVINHEPLFFFLGVHRVLTTSLVAPRPEYRLRDIDSCHLAALKQELLSRPMSSGKTMLVVARGLKEAKNFDEKDMDSYALEVIGETIEGRSSFKLWLTIALSPKIVLSLCMCRFTQVCITYCVKTSGLNLVTRPQ